MGDVLRIDSWRVSYVFRRVCAGIGAGTVLISAALAAGATLSATQTALSVSNDNTGPGTKITLSAHVAPLSGSGTLTGVVDFRSASQDLGSAVVDDQGDAMLATGNLTPGPQQVTAVYEGDGTHGGSVSASAQISPEQSSIAGFTVTGTPTTLKIAAGGLIGSTITVTPVNGFNAYVSLSCSGLPLSSTCTFTPVNVLASCSAGAGNTQTCTPVTSVMQIQTLAPNRGGGTGVSTNSPPRHGGLPAYVFTLPALFGLVGLGRRGRRRISNAVLLLLLAPAVLSVTACREQYNYFNHGPTPNPGTPTGTYTITVDAVSTSGSLIVRPATNLQLTLTVTSGA